MNPFDDPVVKDALDRNLKRIRELVSERDTALRDLLSAQRQFQPLLRQVAQLQLEKQELRRDLLRVGDDLDRTCREVDLLRGQLRQLGGGS